MDVDAFGDAAALVAAHHRELSSIRRPLNGSPRVACRGGASGVVFGVIADRLAVRAR
jgi:hypothetical protein